MEPVKSANFKLNTELGQKRYAEAKRLENEFYEIEEMLDKVTGKRKEALEEYQKELENAIDVLQDQNKGMNDCNAAIDRLNDKQRVFNNLIRESRKRYADLYKIIEASEKSFSAINTTVSSIGKFGGSILEDWEKVDKAASEFSRHLGGSVYSTNKIREDIINFANVDKIGIRFNKSMEDLVKLQSNYADEIGRFISLSNQQRENMAAMSAVMGDTGTKFAAALEKFGLNYNEAAKRAGKLFQQASSAGINFSKATSEVVSHLDLVNRYTFENGIRGLQSMALTASALRLDMQQAASFADKVNNVEGAATSAASLSVLGGSFTNNANPLSMLYESIYDLEGLQDRVISMFGSLGKMNYATGEVEIGAFDKQRVRAAAEASGMGYDKMLDMISTKTRADAIRQLTNGRFANDKAFEDLLANVATIENGRAYVEIGGQSVDVSTLTEKDKGDVAKKAQSTSDDIKEIAENTRSLTDMKEGFQKQLSAAKARHAEQQNIGKWAKNLTDLVGKSSFAIEAIRNFLYAYGAFSMGKQLAGLYPKPDTKTLQGASPIMLNPTPIGPANGGNRAGASTAYGRFLTRRVQNVTPTNLRGGLTYLPPVQANGNQQSAQQQTNGQTGNRQGGQQSNNTVGPTRANATGKTTINPYLYGVGGMLASTGGGMLVGVAENQVASGDWEKNDAATVGAKTLGYALQFGGLGAMIGGGVGAGVGAAIGALYGIGSSGYDAWKYGLIKELQDKGHYLNGDYWPWELQTILGGRAAIAKNKDLEAKVRKNDDMPAFAEGGIVQPYGNDNGTDSKIARVTPGEFITNPSATKRNLPWLEYINKGGDANSFVAQKTVESNNSTVNVKHNPLKFEFGGELRLNSSGYTSDNLLKDQQFLKGLTEYLTKAFNRQANYGYNGEVVKGWS